MFIDAADALNAWYNAAVSEAQAAAQAQASAAYSGASAMTGAAGAMTEAADAASAIHQTTHFRAISFQTGSGRPGLRRPIYQT